MQTPAGFHIVSEGMKARAEITDFWAMVFSPSSMDRLFHTLCGAWQAGAFLVVSVSAWYLLKRKHQEFARASLRLGLIVGLIASLLQLVSGHTSAQGVAKNQPVKLAAFEGLYETTLHAPLTMFGWVDQKNEKTIGPKIPGMLSFLAHKDMAKPVTGLREAAPDSKDRPPVNFTFQMFHLMVVVGLGMIVIAALGFLSFWHGRSAGCCGCSCCQCSARRSPTRPAGSPPKWDVSRGLSRDCFARRRACQPWSRRTWW
jgi:cytochrome d ubiquinol oxidase subunit I